jgi:hypothetical protein
MKQIALIRIAKSGDVKLMREALLEVACEMEQEIKQFRANCKRGRDEASAKLGYRVEGRKAWGRFDLRHKQMAKDLKATGLSLRAVAAELAQRGMLNREGKIYGAQSVRRMIR